MIENNLSKSPEKKISTLQNARNYFKKRVLMTYVDQKTHSRKLGSNKRRIRDDYKRPAKLLPTKGLRIMSQEDNHHMLPNRFKLVDGEVVDTWENKNSE